MSRNTPTFRLELGELIVYWQFFVISEKTQKVYDKYWPDKTEIFVYFTL